jgi:hypothetical protein
MPSKWLKAADLDGKPRLVTIKKFTVEDLGDGKKPAVWFVEEDKALILNIVNGKKIEAICGSGDPENWKGKRVVLYPTETELRGETVDCIRVRAPKPSAAAPTLHEPEPPSEDEVPF